MISLAEQYHRQEAWRRWDEALARIPLRAGQRVLDLRCGVGLVSERPHGLRAQVIGIDFNEELLAAARARHPSTARLRVCSWWLPRRLIKA